MARVRRRRGINNGRRPVNHHRGGLRIRNLIPQKPRKPASAFNLFVRDYFRTTLARQFRTAPEAMRGAAQFWRNHPNQRANYEARARPEFSRFKAAYKQYIQKRELLKRPGNAFIFFVRDVWEREGRGRPISEIGRAAGATWRRMSVAERQPFQLQANQAKETHTRMITELSAGRARFEDYMRPPAGTQGQGQ